MIICGLCTEPPALIQEEMTKAYDHNARKYWVLDMLGDLEAGWRSISITFCS